MIIRAANLGDAEQAVRVMQRSILELCIEDHLDDTESVTMWLANKTIEDFRSWLKSPGQILLVAERDGSICSVGGATVAGEITLNYVAPDARFVAVSRAMVGVLEQRLLDHGNKRSRLVSTRTAHRFYHSVGYVDSGPIEFWGRLPGLPMEKAIA
jgi:predicted GNAT family acetyltransferase